MRPSLRPSPLVQQSWFMGSLVLAGSLLATAPMSAQDMDPGPPAISALAPAAAPQAVRPETVDLAVEHLLTLGTILTDRIDDPVWDLQAETGKQYLSIPLAVPVSDQPVELDANTLRLRGGRFVAWRIPADPAEGGLDPRSDLESPPPGFSDDPNGAAPTAQGLRAIAPEDLPDLVALPPGATASTDQPRLARVIAVDPQGRIRWNMDRFIPTGNVRETDNLYAFKIRTELLNRKEPPRPRIEPAPPGESPQARADRARNQAQAQDRYRQEMTAFSELRRAVMAAPQRFEAPRPRLVWAIFELTPATTRDIHLDGPPPLPWRLPMTQLESLRSLSRSAVGGEGPSREVLIQLHTLVQMVANDPHPLNLRLAAQAMAGAKLLPLARPGDDVHNVCRTILHGQDPSARAALIRELVAVTPSTAATIDLLKLAARNPDPGTQMLALRGLAQSENPDPEVLGLLFETANRLIVNTQAPPPLVVFEEIFAAARSRSPDWNSAFPHAIDPQNPDAAASPGIVDMLLRQIRFQFTDTLRRDQVIAALLVKNNSEPMAFHWLTTQFLGGNDSSLTLRTLELLAGARIVPAPTMAARPIALRLPRYATTLDELYGPLAQPAAEETRPQSIQNPLVTTSDGRVQVLLRQPVLIAGKDHPYLNLLRGDSPAPLREKAWEALPAIVFPTAESPGQSATDLQGRPLAALASETFMAFTDIVLADTLLPPRVVAFLARQPNLIAASGALIRLAGHATDQTGDQILRGLLGSNRPLDQALTGMTIEDCLRFTRRMYDLLTPSAPGSSPESSPGTVPATEPSAATTPASRAPLVVGLLRDRQNVAAMASWFMREISAGRLPTAQAWAQAYGGESALLQQVYSADDELALAAAAGLLAGVQGPEELARTWSDQVRGQPNRSPEFAMGLWNRLKQEVFVLRLKSAAGPYRFSLRVYPAQPAIIGGAFNPWGEPFMEPDMASGQQGPTIPPQSGKPQMEEALGVLVLQADGTKVTFAGQPLNVTVPETALLLRLEKAAELKNLPNPKVAEMSWDRQIEPIDLWPQPDQSWLARFRLIDGRIAELQLTPVPASELPPAVPQPPAPATTPTAPTETGKK